MGLSDIFNASTAKGRANVAKATYASFAGLYLYYRFKKKPSKVEDVKNIQANSNHHKDPSEDSPNSNCHCECSCKEGKTNTTISEPNTHGNGNEHNDEHGHEHNHAHGHDEKKCHNCNHEVGVGNSTLLSPSDECSLKRLNDETHLKSNQFQMKIESTPDHPILNSAEEDHHSILKVLPKDLSENITHVRSNFLRSSKNTQDTDETSQYEDVYEKSYDNWFLWG